MSRRGWVALARSALALLILAAVGYALAGGWSQVRVDLERVSGGALALAFALACGGLVSTLIGWRALLADLGSPLHLAPSAGVFFVGQLGKYLPGSVWTVLAQAEIAARLQVPRRRTAVVGLVCVAMSVVTGLAVGVVALPGLLARGGQTPAVLAGIALVVGIATLHPWLLNRLVALGLRLLRREPLEHELSGRAVLVAAVAFVGAWLCFGVHVWVLATDLGARASVSFVPAVFGYALAASLGILVVVLPAGFGARELVLLLVLVGPLPGPTAAAVVLLSRFVITIADVLAAGAGWAYARRHRLLVDAAG